MSRYCPRTPILYLPLLLLFLLVSTSNTQAGIRLACFRALMTESMGLAPRGSPSFDLLYRFFKADPALADRALEQSRAFNNPVYFFWVAREVRISSEFRGGDLRLPKLIVSLADRTDYIGDLVRAEEVGIDPSSGKVLLHILNGFLIPEGTEVTITGQRLIPSDGSTEQDRPVWSNFSEKVESFNSQTHFIELGKTARRFFYSVDISQLAEELDQGSSRNSDSSSDLLANPFAPPRSL